MSVQCTSAYHNEVSCFAARARPILWCDPCRLAHFKDLFREVAPRLVQVAKLNSGGHPSIYWAELPSAPTDFEVLMGMSAIRLWHGKFKPENLTNLGGVEDALPFIRQVKDGWPKSRKEYLERQVPHGE